MTSGSHSSPEVKHVRSFLFVCLFLITLNSFTPFLGGRGVSGDCAGWKKWLRLALAASQLVQEGKSAVRRTFCSVLKPHLPSRGSQHTLYQLRLTRWNEDIMRRRWQAGFRFWTKYGPPFSLFFFFFTFTSVQKGSFITSQGHRDTREDTKQRPKTLQMCSNVLFTVNKKWPCIGYDCQYPPSFKLAHSLRQHCSCEAHVCADDLCRVVETQ